MKHKDLINVVPLPAKASDEFHEVIAATGCAQAKDLDSYREAYLVDYIDQYETDDNNEKRPNI